MFVEMILNCTLLRWQVRFSNKVVVVWPIVVQKNMSYLEKEFMFSALFFKKENLDWDLSVFNIDI